MMRIFDFLELHDLALYIPEHKALVISDLHVGYEAALNKQGLFVPRLAFRDLMRRLKRIIDSVEVRVVVVNGDLKHEFGSISDQEWRDSLKVLDLLLERSERVVLIRGNHDTVLGPIAEKRRVGVVDSFSFGSVFICHGHIVPEIPAGADVVIIGHAHPAVSVDDGIRSEKFKCFLAGAWKGKKLVVQPSFNLVTAGTDVLSERLLSPFLERDLSDFDIYIVEDRVYDFGKVRSLL